ncbi:mitochondrial glutamate carrier 1-like [Sarcoptes scabiei]|nr:mitochondrial glutamate carrier 1-like [Sarcoptes scabiei]
MYASSLSSSSPTSSSTSSSMFRSKQMIILLDDGIQQEEEEEEDEDDNDLNYSFIDQKIIQRLDDYDDKRDPYNHRLHRHLAKKINLCDAAVYYDEKDVVDDFDCDCEQQHNENFPPLNPRFDCEDRHHPISTSGLDPYETIDRSHFSSTPTISYSSIEEKEEGIYLNEMTSIDLPKKIFSTIATTATTITTMKTITASNENRTINVNDEIVNEIVEHDDHRFDRNRLQSTKLFRYRRRRKRSLRQRLHRNNSLSKFLSGQSRSWWRWSSISKMLRYNTTTSPYLAKQNIDHFESRKFFIESNLFSRSNVDICAISSDSSLKFDHDDGGDHHYHHHHCGQNKQKHQIKTPFQKYCGRVKRYNHDNNDDDDGDDQNRCCRCFFDRIMLKIFIWSSFLKFFILSSFSSTSLITSALKLSRSIWFRNDSMFRNGRTISTMLSSKLSSRTIRLFWKLSLSLLISISVCTTTVFSLHWQENIQPKTRIHQLKEFDVFVGNSTAPDNFKFLDRDGDFLLIGARNCIYNISISTLKENRIYFKTHREMNQEMFRRKLDRRKLGLEISTLFNDLGYSSSL